VQRERLAMRVWQPLQRLQGRDASLVVLVLLLAQLLLLLRRHAMRLTQDACA